MLSMAGVPSALILRNESWVRRQAARLSRRLPANVERADLIQVGLIAVAQAALRFEWDGDRDTEEACSAFVRYARQRVNGAMIDELRQMDSLNRGQRRQVKLLQLARERWHATHDKAPGAADLAALSGLPVADIFAIEALALASQPLAAPGSSDDAGAPLLPEPATAHDEIEARVDTGLLLVRLERFFATLPERERQVIDAYLGIGLTPVQLAASLNVSASRVSQLFRALCERIGVHLARPGHRCIDRVPPASAADEGAARRDAALALAHEQAARAWADGMAAVLMPPPSTGDGLPLMPVSSSARWG